MNATDGDTVSAGARPLHDLGSFLSELVRNKKFSLMELVATVRNNADSPLMDKMLKMYEMVPAESQQQELVDFATVNGLEPLGVLMLLKNVVLDDRDFVRASFRAQVQTNFATDRKRAVVRVGVSRADDGGSDEGYDYVQVCDEDEEDARKFTVDSGNHGGDGLSSISSIILDRAKVDMNMKFVLDS